MKKVTIKAPKIISLYTKPQALNTINFISKIYRFLSMGYKLVLDFSHTKEITAAASVVVFAHINRAQLFSEEKEIFEFICSPSILQEYLVGIYFSALSADSEEKLQLLENNKCPFQSGTKPHLKLPSIKGFCQELRENFSGDTEKIKTLNLIETAISEALLNVEHHAYLGTEIAIDSRWWQLLWHSKSDNRVNFVIYDLGIGIVDSFKNHNQNTENMILTNPIEILLETLKPGITRWNSIERGNGLPEVIKPTESDKVGLWISSNDVIYENAKEFNIEHKANYSGFFLPGTLVEWSFSLD